MTAVGLLARARAPHGARRRASVVVMGTHDFTPAAAGAGWAAAPGARLLRVDAGHYVHLEAPAVVLPAVDAFLGGAGPAGAVVVRR